MALQLYNVNVPIGWGPAREAITLAQEWVRFFKSIVTEVNNTQDSLTALTSRVNAINSVPQNSVMAFVGATAPTGYTHDTTAGLPSLPAGYIWIKKS